MAASLLLRRYRKFPGVAKRTTKGRDGSRTVGSIYANELEALVPRQYWQVERIDGFANSATDPLKLQRRKVAHFWMSRELYSSPEGQA